MPKAKYLELSTKEIVFEEGRQRQTYEDIEELAESIKEKGLLQPLGVEEKTNYLVWGGRRYKAICQLGLEKVSCRIVPKGLSQLELEEIELEENIQRKNLTWQERVNAIKRIDQLKKQLHGDQSETGSRADWSTRKTADLLGKSSGGVSDDIALADAIERFPELANCKTANEARKGFKKIVERLAVGELVRKAKEEGTSTAFKFAERHYTVGDALEGLKLLDQTVASFAIVDPPYAVDLGKTKKVDKSRENIDVYNEWLKKDYIPKITEVATHLHRVLAEHAWLVWWYGQEWYKETYTVLKKAGFEVDKIPATWGKIDATGQTNQPDIYLGRATETFFVCRKGSPAMAKRGRSNLFLYKPVPAQRKIHPTEKPLDLIQDIFDTFTYPGSVSIIPFLGSGVDLRAAYSRQQTGFGWDLSNEYKERFLYKVQEDIENELYK